jgi:erythromycin esterase
VKRVAKVSLVSLYAIAHVAVVTLASSLMSPVIRLRPHVLWLVAAALVLTACGSESPDPPTTPVTPKDSTPVVAGGSTGLPEGWVGSAANGHELGVATGERHGGAASLYVKGPATVNPNVQGAVVIQSIKADPYRGKRVRLSAWAKPVGVSNAMFSGIWMRVDAPNLTPSFDNMASRPVTGSGDWRQISVVLDVPTNAIGIGLGVLFVASNILYVDDFKLEIVGTDVPTTAPPYNSATTTDSATLAVSYERRLNALVNQDFEGLAGPAQATIDWVSRTASPITTTDPDASLSDLEPLRAMIGSSRLVGLGEGTHGTREFFRMKHRILKYLVANMGFTHFAIEATSPESDDMNRYVLTGDGDPARWLSRLYFWTWNTQEVLDMVRWMREWNLTAPADKRVQFVGFDMQSPGAAMDSVFLFVQRVDAANSSQVADRHACLVPYRNQGRTPGRPITEYAAKSATERTACAAAAQGVIDFLKSRRTAYEAASSPAKYQAVLHAAQLVQQFERVASVSSNSAAGSRARDLAMAENVMWIRDQAGPTAKIALWAHNGHINAISGLMGGHLRAAYGTDYLTLGFAFGLGDLNAIGPTISGSLRSWPASLQPKTSIEAVFVGTGKPGLLLDMRQVASGGSAAAPLRGPIQMRSVGSVFNPSSEASHFTWSLFPDDFDLLIYLSNTSASRLLPFIN